VRSFIARLPARPEDHDQGEDRRGSEREENCIPNLHRKASTTKIRACESLPTFESRAGILPFREITSRGHRSRASFRFPQCVSLRSRLNTRSTFRLSAFNMPLWANIIGARP